MKAKFSIIKPDDIEAEMTVSMTLGEWEKVRACLHDGASCYQYNFSYRIREMIQKAKEAYTANNEPLGEVYDS